MKVDLFGGAARYAKGSLGVHGVDHVHDGLLVPFREGREHSGFPDDPPVEFLFDRDGFIGHEFVDGYPQGFGEVDDGRRGGVSNFGFVVREHSLGNARHAGEFRLGEPLGLSGVREALGERFLRR